MPSILSDMSPEMTNTKHQKVRLIFLTSKQKSNFSLARFSHVYPSTQLQTSKVFTGENPVGKIVGVKPCHLTDHRHLILEYQLGDVFHVSLLEISVGSESYYRYPRIFFRWLILKKSNCQLKASVKQRKKSKTQSGEAT